MTRTKSTCLALIAVLLSPMAAHADPILSRSDLQTLLGGPGAVEDFESFVLGGGGVGFGCDTGDVFDATSTCNGQGPGLVDSNLRLLKDPEGGFQMDSAGYFGATSNEFLIGAPADQPLIIDFLSGVGAFGLDLRAFSGFAAVAQLIVYGLDDSTVLGLISDIVLGSDGISVFAGWSDISGIGSFSLTQTGQLWSPIVDNIEWGAVSVPEPGTLALFGIGLFGMGLSRRKKV